MIRAALEEDVLFIAENGKLMAEESSYKVYNYDVDKVAALVMGLVRSDMGFVYIAELDGKRVGWMFGACVEHWFSHDKVATEMTTYILPEFRGSMLAPKLLKTFKKWAKEQGAKEVQVGITTGVFEDRTSNLYERLGFHPAGRIFKEQLCAQV